MFSEDDSGHRIRFAQDLNLNWYVKGKVEKNSVIALPNVDRWKIQGIGYNLIHFYNDKTKFKEGPMIIPILLSIK